MKLAFEKHMLDMITKELCHTSWIRVKNIGDKFLETIKLFITLTGCSIEWDNKEGDNNLYF